MWIDGPTFRAVTIGTGPTNPIPQKNQGTSPAIGALHGPRNQPGGPSQSA